MYVTYKRNGLYQLILLVYIIVSLISITACQETEQTAAPQSWLFFEETQERKQILHAINVDGQEDKILLSVDYPILEPQRLYVSPDAHYLVIDNFDELILFNLAKSQEMKRIDIGIPTSEDFLTIKRDNIVAWSDINDKFAFLKEQEGPYADVVEFDLDTMQERTLVHEPYKLNSLAWTANDNKQVAFTFESCRVNVSPCPTEQTFWDVGLINTATPTNPVSLRVPEKLSLNNEWAINGFCNLIWSPDGQYVAFKSYCLSEGIQTVPEMFVANIDDGQVWQLTDFGDIDFSNHYLTYWSPDSEYLFIAYKRDYIFDDLQDGSGFIVYALNSSLAQPMAIHQIDFDFIRNLHWAPNGDFLVGSKNDRSFLAKVQGANIDIVVNNLPILSPNGIWQDDSYITTSDGRVIEIELSTGQITDLDVGSNVSMSLIGGYVVIKK